VFFFFFSSRRRHTRSDRDWSSDVCSSDLEAGRERERDDPPQDTPFRVHDPRHLHESRLDAELTRSSVDLPVDLRQGRLQALDQLLSRQDGRRIVPAGVMQLEYPSRDRPDILLDPADTVRELQLVGWQSRGPAIEPEG